MAHDIGLKAIFINLRRKGHSYTSISKTLDVSRQTLYEWRKTILDKIKQTPKNTSAADERIKLKIAQTIETLCDHFNNKDVIREMDAHDIERTITQLTKCLKSLDQNDDELLRQI